MLNNNILIIAHRGYSAKYPESTRLAYTKAIELGVDFIEADIQLSKDGQFLVFHDDDLSRVTDAKGKICDYNVNDLKKFNVKADFGDKYGFQPIITLDELIDIVGQSKVKLCLELKDVGSREIKNYEELIIPYLIKHNFERKTVINLPDTYKSDEFANACVKKYNYIKIAYDFAIKEDKVDKIENFIDRCLFYGVRIVEYEYSFLSKDVIRELKSNGIGIWTWTINNENDMINAIEMGVDGILTDDPYTLCQLLNRA